MAGPVWFSGQNLSFRSKEPHEFENYQDFEDTFFKHFKFVYSK
jgi:hypothetical protein